MLDALTRPVRQSIARPVIELLTDEAPVVPGRDGLFAPDAAARRVHGDAGTMMIGGVAALLMQMLHPAALAGVLGHSDFRGDMGGRLRRTARFMAVTTFAGRAEALAAIERVRAIHRQVRGAGPDGAPYDASDPRLLAWVHVAGAASFLAAWRRYAEPAMSARDRDRYFAETALVAEALGAEPAPRSEAEAQRLIGATRGELRSDPRTAEMARLVLAPDRDARMPEPARRLMLQAGIDVLPDWARRMHGLANPALGRPLLRASALAATRTLRWALATR